MGTSQGSVTESLDAIERRIRSACERAGRPRESVTLIGVSKRQPLERLHAAYGAGLRTFGENQVQEALGKVEVMPSDVDWHFIGHLQSNKLGKAAQYFDTIHSVDRPKTGRILEQKAGAFSRRLRLFVQVNLGEEPQKQGFSPRGLPDAIRPMADHEHSEVVGLMAIPPREPGDDAQRLEAARGWFSRLRDLRDELASRPEWSGFPGWLSMGMSHDFEVAIAEGATHIRVGSSIFGERPVPARAEAGG